METEIKLEKPEAETRDVSAETHAVFIKVEPQENLNIIPTTEIFIKIEKKEDESSCEDEGKTNKNFDDSRCDLCQKQFPHKRSLKQHKDRVHVPQNFKCSVCPSKFKVHFKLRVHAKKFHGGKRGKLEILN